MFGLEGAIDGLAALIEDGVGANFARPSPSRPRVPVDEGEEGGGEEDGSKLQLEEGDEKEQPGQPQTQSSQPLEWR